MKLKFRFVQKAIKFLKIFQLIGNLPGISQINWEISSNFVTFLENLNIILIADIYRPYLHTCFSNNFRMNFLILDQCDIELCCHLKSLQQSKEIYKQMATSKLIMNWSEKPGILCTEGIFWENPCGDVMIAEEVSSCTAKALNLM